MKRERARERERERDDHKKEEINKNGDRLTMNF
jgi:hypothetical protein